MATLQNRACTSIGRHEWRPYKIAHAHPIAMPQTRRRVAIYGDLMHLFSNM